MDRYLRSGCPSSPPLNSWPEVLPCLSVSPPNPYPHAPIRTASLTEAVLLLLNFVHGPAVFQLFLTLQPH